MASSDVKLRAQFDEYVQFVRDRLRPDYEALVREEQQVETEIHDYEDLMGRLNELLQSKDDKMMEVDLGHGKVLCRAKIDDDSTWPRVMYVHVGMGFHVELTFQEALEWIPKRIVYLKKTVLAHRKSKTKTVWVHLQSSERILDELSLELRRIK
jgi:prefoldin subunit 5